MPEEGGKRHAEVSPDLDGGVVARPTLFTHPKFQRLVYMLGVSDAQVLGHLEFMWNVGYASGEAVLGDEIDVELAAKWTGEPRSLATALEERRFIDRRPDGLLEIHDLWDHAPMWAKVRRYKRMARALGFGDPRRWPATRIRILTRDSWTCRYCGGYANTVDHVVARVLGGDHADSNLVAACRTCNSRKQHRTAEAAGLVLRG